MPPSTLDVLKASPVRGQLEAWDPRTPKGTRYIQTTDTCDELKVLLPPGTAAMYEQLLKLENYELSKKGSVSWSRIMEIRHLKDRMVRKCQKLAKTQDPVSKRGSDLVFQTYVAPPDFRLKEMEKWFREQQKKLNPTSVARQSSAYAYLGGPSTSTQLTRHPSTSSSKHQVQRSITNPEPSSSTSYVIAKPKPTPPFKALPTLQPAPRQMLQIEHTSAPISAVSPLPHSANSTGPPETAMIYAKYVNEIASPPPLPTLTLRQREDYGLESSSFMSRLLAAESPVDAGAGPGAGGGPENDSNTIHPPQPPPEGTAPPPAADQQERELPPAVPPPNQAEPGEATARRPLQRRPSAIKRNSVTELKTVSWADTLDKQSIQYANAAKEAQASGKWSEVRSLYLDQIAGLENLQRQVQEGLEHLRFETDHLQKIDETIRGQREALNAMFQQFEQKHIIFQEKVQEALTEAANVLTEPPSIVAKNDLTPIDEA